MMSYSSDRFANSSETSREFLLSSVKIYFSNAASAVFRKPLTNRKKVDKRDSVEDIRLKEKSSSKWLSHQQWIGLWRSAKCKLLEEGERCLLNVYVDERLYQTVYIHLLNQTDIRQADNSLFHLKDCLGIFSISGQRWVPSNAAEPLYFHFPNSDTCSTWQALLKSYAIPEIYGRWFFPMDGGSYRMWRQVELTVNQGKNLGIAKEDVKPAMALLENDNVDTNISCEIHLNDILCSRTTAKGGLASCDWHESFSFPGLPPFDNLDIVVWQEKPSSKPAVIGKIRIALNNFRRGDTVEGWFPVLKTGPLGTEVQFGELRLKVRVDEEIILPYSSYSSLMTTCNSRSFLKWMSDLESRLKLKNISTHLMSIAVATNVVIEQVQEYASQEVDTSSASHQTLFRGNTTLTKVIELCMTWYGNAFLEASIGKVLRRLCSERIVIEVDPVRSGKSNKDVERNVEQLVYWCHEIWNQIYSVREECPNEMRMVFKTIRKLVEQRYRPDPGVIDPKNYLPWQSVSAFCFLRFIVPAILHPHLFGLSAGLPPLPVQRSLTLIAKVIQSLANLNSNVQKETFMRGVQDFLKDSLPAMIDYIAVVSTPLEEASPAKPEDNINRHDRLNIVNALRQRTKNMTVLDREAVPILPHLLDVPKHLAIITSAVIRSSRDLNTRPRTGDDTDLAVDEFCSKCFEVEEEALLRVSQLAAKLASESARNATQDDLHEQPARSPLKEVTSTIMTPKNSRPPHRRKFSRPSTAPSPYASNDSSYQTSYTDSSNKLRTFTRIIPNEQWNGENTQHLKGPSTDSVSLLGDNDMLIPVRFPLSKEVVVDVTDEAGKKKKGLLRGILRR